MNKDIGNIIKSCKICNKPNKFKSMKKKLKLFQIMGLIIDMQWTFGT